MIIKNCLAEEEKKNTNNLDLIFNSITNKLYEEFLLSKDNENKKKEEMTTKYLNNKGDCDLNILPIKEEKTQTFNDVDSTLRKTEMMFSNYQWNFLNSNINTFQISKIYCLKILFDDLKSNFDINPDEITINLTKFDDKSNNNSKFEQLSEIIMKDNSYMTKSLLEKSDLLKKRNNRNFLVLRGKSFDNQIKDINPITGNFIDNAQENKSVVLPNKCLNYFLNKEENENTQLLKSYIENEVLENSKSERLKEKSEIYEKK